MARLRTRFIIPQFTVAHFSHHLSTGALVPLLPMIRDTFGISYMQSGLLVSAFSISHGLGQIPMALIADRTSRRRVILLGLIGTALCSIAIGATTSYWQMIPGFIAMGILGGTYHPPASSFLSQSVPRGQRGRSLGIHIIGGSLSFLLTPILAVSIAQWSGNWRWSFIILAFPAILSSIMIWITTEDPQPEPVAAALPAQGSNATAGADTRAGETVSISFWEIFRAIGTLASICLLIQLVSASVNSYLPMYLVDRHGLPIGLAGIAVGLVYGAGIVGAPLGGSLSDRLGRKAVILLSVALSGPLLLAATLSPGVGLLLTFITAYGVVISMRMPTMESLIADVVPLNRRALALGIYYLMSMETTGIITPLIGRLIDIQGLDPVFVGLALGLSIAGIIVLLLRKLI
ncbi:MAG: MFS transporter [Deltaproteobacteria bacterium]|nr:MFS transporter [Deltaproteobacteria bacterium]